VSNGDVIDTGAGGEIDLEVGKVDVGGKLFPLVLADRPHGTLKKYGYAKIDDECIAFNGRQRLFKIEIAEENYIRINPHPSEVRSGCSVVVLVDGLEVWRKKCRDRKLGAELADRYIDDMQEQDHWRWFPLHIGDLLGQRIGYGNTVSEIVEFLVSKSRMTIRSVYGNPYPRLLSEDSIDHQPSTYKEIDILDPAIVWEIAK
jgi:hypothetical protein